MASGVLGHGVDDVARGGELLTVLAGVLGVGDGLKAVTRAGAGLTADEHDLGVVAADVLPVGDLAGVDLGDGVNVDIGDRVLGVHDNGDAVERDDGLNKAGGLFVILERTARKADVAAVFKHGLYAGA